MLGCKLADFDILISGEKAPYTVTAFYGGYDPDERASANGTFAPDIRHPEWQKAYHALGETMKYADADTIMDVGSRLWAALIHGRVRDLWIAARADVDHERVDGLRLRLDLQSPHVSALPWESLYDADRNVVFAAHPRYSLVRVASLYERVGPNRRGQIHLPMRVLIAAPDDPTGVIDAQAEIAEIKEIMANLNSPHANLKEIDVKKIDGGFSITELRNAIAELKPTILHFIGHGDPNGLRLWPKGRHYMASAHSLRSIMERSASVKLVVLNACLLGRSPQPRPFSGIADQMMQAGVPAVVAMQYQIKEHAAIDFAHFLYAELLGDTCPGIIDYAMSAARSGLYAANPGDFSFGTPVLWLKKRNGCIFSLDEEPVDEQTSHVEALPGLMEPPTLDLQEEGAWIDEMVATTDLTHLQGELAFLRSKWSNFVDELRNLLVQLSALAHQPDNPVYIEKVADYRRIKAALLRVKRLIEEANGTL
jgi:hypothetical protein